MINIHFLPRKDSCPWKLHRDQQNKVWNIVTSCVCSNPIFLLPILLSGLERSGTQKQKLEYEFADQNLRVQLKLFRFRYHYSELLFLVDNLHWRASAESWTEICEGGMSRPDKMSCFNWRNSWYLKKRTYLLPKSCQLDIRLHSPCYFFSQVCWIGTIELNSKVQSDEGEP